MRRLLLVAAILAPTAVFAQTSPTDPVAKALHDTFGDFGTVLAQTRAQLNASEAENARLREENQKLKAENPTRKEEKKESSDVHTSAKVP